MTESNHDIYDIIIVGGGLAGLYSAYNIQKISPACKLLVLESYKKNWLGGRINNEMFQGVQVVTGAGVGRKEKDFLLIDLLKELKIPFTDCNVTHHYSPTIDPRCSVKKTLKSRNLLNHFFCSDVIFFSSTSSFSPHKTPKNSSIFEK